MLTYLIQTFGCKSNQYESQAIRESLAAGGFVETAELSDAMLYIINTCGVTGRAGASCRNAIRKALRANPALRIVVTGCGVDLGDPLPETSPAPLLIPNAKKHAFPSLILSWLDDTAPEPAVGEDRFALSISSFQGHTRAFLKVQDGCDNYCTYCAVPRARGRPQSRPSALVLDEAKRLVGSGHPELVLTGINIGVYNDGVFDFADLVVRLAETPGLVRLRLGSVEPPQMTERLADSMRSNSRICPHVHLPLQSGDDRVLAAMGRRYGSGEFLEKAAMLRERLHLPAVTTDVIVGFPGEDAAAFKASMDVCRRARFSRIHLFLFSARPGTPAAAMRRTVADREIEEWKTALIELGRESAERYAASCVGLEERVIVERGGEGAHGLTDRYLTARLACAIEPGETRNVVVTGHNGVELSAQLRQCTTHNS